MQNWFRKITVIILTGFVLMFSQNATVMAAQTNCANCYYCARWGANGCLSCVYDEAYCIDIDVPGKPDIPGGGFDIVGLSLQCQTIIALSDNCARHIAIEDPMYTDSYLYLNCERGGTPYSDYLAYAMCGDDDVCFEQLATNWEMYTEALCFSGSALELGDYLGISSADCEISLGVVLPSDNRCPECSAGEYYDKNAWNCYPCPELDGATANTVLSGKLAPITMCYIPSASTMQDTSGTYQFTNDCPYTR